MSSGRQCWRQARWREPGRHRESHQVVCSSRRTDAKPRSCGRTPESGFNPMELIAKRRQTGTGNLWNLLVLRIGDDIKQLLNTLTADRRNDAKLSAMGSDCIDHRGLLSNKQVPRAMEHQAALLFRCLGWHKPHVGPADRLAYRLGISGIVLLSFDIGLHIGRWH